MHHKVMSPHSSKDCRAYAAGGEYDMPFSRRLRDEFAANSPDCFEHSYSDSDHNTLKSKLGYLGE